MIFEIFRIPSLANILGFLSLIFFALSLTPSIVRALFVNLRNTKVINFLSKKRRIVGILVFIFGLLHGIVIGFERNLNFFELPVIIKYLQGVILLSVFCLLTITSNDYSVKKLKKNWKRLHRLSYAMVFVAIWHILDKVKPQWTIITPIALIILFTLAISLVLRYNKAKKRRRKIPLP
jgi:sulfoxide reductase heme-binding subunit YedZ